jgi:hypothetical protein
MPSGFQQDPNQLQPAYFRVVMTMTDTNNIYRIGGNSNGSVQPFTWDNYTGNDLPHTMGSATALARGNIRFQRIIEELTKYADAQILDLEALTGSNPPTGEYQVNHLAFTVKYDRFGIEYYDATTDSDTSGLLLAEQQYLRSINNGSTHSPYDGKNINHTYEAIQEAIMRALIETATRSVRVFEPVEGTDPIVGEGKQQYITANDVTYSQDECNYSQLRDTITVNGPLDGTTLITTDEDAV